LNQGVVEKEIGGIANYPSTTNITGTWTTAIWHPNLPHIK